MVYCTAVLVFHFAHIEGNPKMMISKTKGCWLELLLAIGALASVPAHAGATLDKIKKKRSSGLRREHRSRRVLEKPMPAATGPVSTWTSTKAIAAAVLGDANKVKWVPLNAQQRFTALQSGEVDILSRNTTFPLTRDASLGPARHQRHLLRRPGLHGYHQVEDQDAKQLKGQTVCVQSGTTTERT